MEQNQVTLSEVFKQLKELNKRVENLEKITKFGTLKLTKKDLEVLRLINEMQEARMWGTEEDLKKVGITI